MVQAMLSQVCAVKSLAAICPAAAGLGRWVKSMGTTTKPRQVRLPHHKAATIKPKR